MVRYNRIRWRLLKKRVFMMIVCKKALKIVRKLWKNTKKKWSVGINRPVAVGRQGFDEKCLLDEMFSRQSLVDWKKNELNRTLFSEMVMLTKKSCIFLEKMVRWYKSTCSSRKTRSDKKIFARKNIGVQAASRMRRCWTQSVVYSLS